jgi:hypothetical protein
MPIFQFNDPLSAAAQTIGDIFTQKRENQKYADAERRLREEFEFKKQQAQQDQANADRSFGLESKRTDASINSQRIHDQVLQASAAREARMAPLLERAQELQNQLAQGAISQQKFDAQMKQVTLQGAKIDLDLKKKYGPQAAALAIQQTQAGINATNAGTASTMLHDMYLPQEMQDRHAASQAATAGQIISNQYSPSIFESQVVKNQGGATTDGPPISKQAEAEYTRAMTNYNSRLNAALGDTTKVGPMPTAPGDWQADIANIADVIRSGRGTVQQAKESIQKSSKYTVAQKRQALLWLDGQFGAKNKKGSGGSQAAPPFPGP